MKRPERTINKAIGREGRGLAGAPWLRVSMAFFLALAGLWILYVGFDCHSRLRIVLGSAFIVYAALVCVLVRRAEKIIKTIEKKVEYIEGMRADRDVAKRVKR